MSDKTTSEIHHIDGRPHLIHHVQDEEGNPVATVSGPLKVEFHLEDFMQLIAGASIMALPVAMGSDVWSLGTELSAGRALTIFTLSILTLGAFIWALFYGKRINEYRGHFVRRVVSAYLVTFLIAFLLLFLFDKAPLDDLQVTLTRTILVAFPASFAATAVDFMN